MKTNKYLGILAAALCFAACQEKLPQEKGVPQEEETVVPAGDFTLLASTGEITKTELDGENYITWKSGDALSIWEQNGSSNVKFTLDAASAGERKGAFTADFTPASDEFSVVGIYPYSAEYGNDATAVPVTIPATVDQKTSANAVVGVSDFMFGSASLKTTDETYEMSFTHPLALLDIVVDGSGSCLRTATLQKVTFTSNGAAVAGAFTANLSDGTLTPAAEGSSKSIEVNFPETARMSGANHAWIAINPVDLTTDGCTFVINMTNGQQITFTVKPKAAFEAQKIYTINLNDIDTRVDKGQANPLYVDLIAANGGQRANCYIVREGGYYRFAAQRVDKSNVFGSSTTGYTADWLWATGSASKVDGVGFGKSGNVNFRVQAEANCNAVIALRDADGNIAWSWHIWCTVEDPMSPTHYGRNDAWLMSARNLGALSGEQGNPATCGLYYQFGRKDPFPGPNTAGSNVAGKEATAFVNWTETYVINPKATGAKFSSTRNTVAGATDEIAYTIANPMTNVHFYAAGSEGLTNTWFYKTASADAAKLWTSTGDKKGKTNYDPCPPGYMVPVSNGYAWYTTWNNNADFESNTNLSGVWFHEKDSNCSYYPACGYRDSGQLKNLGYAAYYWAANAKVDGTSFIAYGLGYSGRTTKSNGQKLSTSYGLPVRCMKI